MLATDIVNNNRLIAVFMNLKQDENGLFYTNHTSEIATCWPCWYSAEDLNYNNSFDWLMPVFNRISTINEYKYNFKLSRQWCELYENNYNKLFENSGVSTLEALYLTVVEFINWYNEKNNIN